MKKKKSNAPLILVLLVLVALAGCLLAAMVQFSQSHFFVSGHAYPYEAAELNLRDRELSIGDYEVIQSRLPDCEIRWYIPFQSTAYPDDTEEISISSLSDRELDMLPLFWNLKTVDATACRDYDQLQQLMQTYPQLQVAYEVTVEGQTYPWDTQSLVCTALSDEDIAMMTLLPRLQTVDATACRDFNQIGKLKAACPNVSIAYIVELMGQTFTEEDTAATFQNPDVDQLLEKLVWLPHMEAVHLNEPAGDAWKLVQLQEEYPHVTFTWNKTIFDGAHSSTQTEFDFSGQTLTTDIVEEAMAWFPNAEKVIMSDCGIDNETMAAFREKMRPQYKVVWTVYVTKKPVRTDQEVIHSSAMKVSLIDEQSFDLKYCEDAIVVDIGHSYIKDISWVKGMPKLKYLILSDNWIKDLTPISTCKNLIHLEMFDNKHTPDYTPLLECTALEDLNLSGTYADIDPLKEMTWLKNLWLSCRGLYESEYNELKAALPDTHIEYQSGYTTMGWRQLQNYFDMRDIMGLPYNAW